MKKSTFSKLLKGVSASLAAAILLSACGAGGKTTDTGAGTADSTAGSTAAATSLNLAVTTGDGSSTDDKIPTPWYNRTLATNLMFRSLFLADSTLAEVKPDLAESYKVSDDGLVYTIQMKDGLKWSDGEALTADDVVWSIQTALTAAQINPNYATAFANIKDLSAADGTVTITLSTPYSAMAAVLAQFAILPQHSLKDADPLKMESDKFWTAPVCSGMYTLDELKPGNYFTLKVNDQYEGAAPKIPGVTVYFVADYITAAQSGKADYVFGNASDLVETLSGMPNYTANKVDVLFYKYFLFNMKGADGKENTAMQNPLVRKALIESIDRTALASLYPNANILSSGVPMTDSANNGFEWKYDPEQAKADLKASGYDMSRTLRICYYNNDQTSIDLINAVVYYLEQIGLKVEATLSNDGTTDLFTTREYDMGFKGKSAFTINEWYTEYMSGDALFSKVFGGDTAFDSSVAALLAATDDGARKTALASLQKLEQDNIYKVPMFTVGTYVFTSNHVKVPSGVTFCNPLYMCDLDFANWELA